MVISNKHIPRPLLLSILLVLVMGVSVLVGTGKLDHARAAPGLITSNPYTKAAGASPPNCTWYVWQRLSDEGIDMQEYGYANQWSNFVYHQNEFYLPQTKQFLSQQQVQVTTSQPSNVGKGDFIVLPIASAYANPYHVAFIDGVNSNGTLSISEQNNNDSTSDGYQPYPNAPYTHHRVWAWSSVQSAEGGKALIVHFSLQLSNPVVGHALPQAGASHSPVIIENANGQEEIFMVGRDTQLYHEWQNSNGSWSGWYNLHGSWPKDPAVDRDHNGVLEVFMVGNTGSNGTATLFHAWQTSPGSNNWTGWYPMAGIWPSETPSVTYNLSGEQEVFMRGLNAQIYHAWLSSNGWTSWYSLGGNAAKDPIAVQNANGLLGVFYVGADRQLYYNWENSGGSWGNGTNLGGSWPNNPTVNLNQNGILEAFAIGNTGSNGAGLFHAWQTSPGSTSWTGWSIMSGNWPAGVPTVTQNTVGDLEIFMLGLNNYHLYHAWQTSPGSTNWTIFYDFGQYWSRYPVVFKRSNGLMDVFLVGLNSVLYHIPQNSNAGWASPTSLNGIWP